MTRDQKIAHLTIHGWVPITEGQGRSAGIGLGNAEQCEGYTLSYDYTDVIKRIAPIIRFVSSWPATDTWWGNVPDAIIDFVLEP